MIKSEQLLINDNVLAWEQYVQGTRHYDTSDNRDRLYSCKAYTYSIPIIDSDDVYYGSARVLVSYTTPVALLFDGYCFDFLRYAYGYTATSAQHIAKACRKYHVTEVQRYYPL